VQHPSVREKRTTGDFTTKKSAHHPGWLHRRPQFDKRRSGIAAALLGQRSLARVEGLSLRNAQAGRQKNEAGLSALGDLRQARKNQ
jgi:hypothetical protein